MSDKHEGNDKLDGLTAASALSFPKQCTACGRRYETAEAFIKETQSVSEGRSGLKSTLDETDRPVIELFRNCCCGSTLMDRFNDRRDLSNEGLRRRRLFDRFLALLVNKGMSVPDARVELLKIMRGERSAVLKDLGLSNGDIDL